MTDRPCAVPGCATPAVTALCPRHAEARARSGLPLSVWLEVCRRLVEVER